MKRQHRGRMISDDDFRHRIFFPRLLACIDLIRSPQFNRLATTIPNASQRCLPTEMLLSVLRGHLLIASRQWAIIPGSLAARNIGTTARIDMSLEGHSARQSQFSKYGLWTTRLTKS